MLKWSWAAVLLMTVSSSVDGAEKWYKGNTHTHTFWSDGNDFPERIAKWYAENGYDFLVLSDHNILSRGEKWMTVEKLKERGGNDILEKYAASFGKEWVESRGTPGEKSFEIRLKRLAEFRDMFEVPAKFLMIEGEEISDKAEDVPVHMNAINVQSVIAPAGGATALDALKGNVRIVAKQSRLSKQPILLHLNHPNFHYAITAEELASVIQQDFFEICNTSSDCNQLGDEFHPSLDEFWDIANTLRLAKLQSPPLFGVGVDDAHNYHGRGSSPPGGSFVMVRSKSLKPAAIITAMRIGEFYSSSGVLLTDVQYSARTKEYVIDIQAEDGVTYTTQFVGTLTNADLGSRPRPGVGGAVQRATRIYSDDVGKVLATVKGDHASYSLSGKELYVRAVITSDKKHSLPTYPGQLQQAWVQPVGWRR